MPDLILNPTYSLSVRDGSASKFDSFTWSGPTDNDPPLRLYRCGWKFDLSTLPVGATVTAATFDINVSGAGVAGNAWSIGAYGGDGSGDIETDDAATINTGFDVSADYYVNDADFTTTGVKSLTLDSSSHSEIAAQQGGTFTLACRQNAETVAQTAATLDPTVTPPVLTITYTEGSPSLTIDSTDASMQKQSTFGMTVSNPPVTPTASNTSLTLGAIQIPLSQATNTSGDTWDLEFPIGDIPRQADGTGYDWTLDVGTAVVANTAPVVSLVGNASIPLTVGDTYTEQGATVADSEDGALAIGAPIFSPPLDLTTAGTYVATYSVTDSGGLVGTATRNVVVSASGGSLPAPTLFADSFESGSMAAPTASVDTANFAWGAHNYSYLVDVNTDQILWRSSGASTEVITPNDWEAKAGSRALRFNYRAGESMSEQRFSIDPQTELWVRYWARVPTNFRHGSGGATNNKFFAIWMNAEGDYSLAGEGSTVAWEFWNDGSDGSEIAFHSSDETFSVMGSHQQLTPFISYPADQGRWMQVVLHVKAATSTDSNDGIIEMHRRWEDESSFTQIHYTNTADIGVPSGLDAFAFGYFMGWSNPAYTDQTEWIIDDVEFSSESLL